MPGTFTLDLSNLLLVDGTLTVAGDYTPAAVVVAPPTPIPTPAPPPPIVVQPPPAPVAPVAVAPTYGAEPLAKVALGVCPDLLGWRPFTPAYAYYQPITGLPVDPATALWLGSTIYGGVGLHLDDTIPFNVVDSDLVPALPLFVNQFAADSDNVLFPGTGCAVESPVDAHCLVLNKAKSKAPAIHEAYQFGYNPDGTPNTSGKQVAAGQCVFGACIDPQRPTGMSSDDAGGLSVFSGLLKYDDAARGPIGYSVRMTVQKTENDGANGYFVPPASHAAGNLYGAPFAMGTQLRLKPGFDASWMNPIVQNIVAGLQEYGMHVADNGSTFFIQAASDPRWTAEIHSQLATITGIDFEIILQDKFDAVTAVVPPAPVISSFTGVVSADKSTVTLTWSVTGQTHLFIDGFDYVEGTTVTLPFTPGASYALVASNANQTRVELVATLTTP